MLKEKRSEEGVTINAFLGNKTNFNGTLIFDGVVRIDGAFKGNIISNDTLIIANTGNVEADIETAKVKISGNFKGTIKANSMVELLKPAMVTGTIVTPVIKIEEGVKINGSIQMADNTAEVSQ